MHCISDLKDMNLNQIKTNCLKKVRFLVGFLRISAKFIEYLNFNFFILKSAYDWTFVFINQRLMEIYLVVVFSINFWFMFFFVFHFIYFLLFHYKRITDWMFYCVFFLSFLHHKLFYRLYFSQLHRNLLKSIFFSFLGFSGLTQHHKCSNYWIRFNFLYIVRMHAYIILIHFQSKINHFYLEIHTCICIYVYNAL